jgi:hypothetical protein
MSDRHLPLGTVKDKSFWVNLSLNSEAKPNIPIAPFGKPHLQIWHRNPDGSDEFFVFYCSSTLVQNYALSAQDFSCYTSQRMLEDGCEGESP